MPSYVARAGLVKLDWTQIVGGTWHLTVAEFLAETVAKKFGLKSAELASLQRRHHHRLPQL